MAAKKNHSKQAVSPSVPDTVPREELEKLRVKLRQNQKALRASQAEYQQLLSHDSHGIRIINKNFTVRLVNQTFSHMSGINTSESVGRKCYELFPGPYCHTPNCRLTRIIGGEKFIQAEIERVMPDGRIIPCIVNAVPLCNEKGELEGVIETFTDISEKRQLEGQVKESEDRYRALIELGSEAGEAIVMLQDIDGREGIQTFVSDQWPRMTGYDKEELLGSCFFDLLAAEDCDASIERHRLKLTGTPVPGLYQMQIVRKDATKAVIEVTGAFTKYQGQKANVLYIRDVTERKMAENRLRDSEERYRSLFEDVPVAIWELDYSAVKKYLDSLRTSGVTDIRNYFTQHPETTLHCLKLGTGYGANQAAIELYEAESREQLYTELFDLLQKRPDGLERDMENFIALAEGATEIKYVHRDPTFKGNWKYTSVQYRIAPGHEEDWTRLFGSFFDITERVEAEKKLEAYHEHLKELVDERTSQLTKEVEHGRLMEEKLRELYEKESQLRKEMEEQIKQRIYFTRAVVHELKTPLTPLIGANELLKTNLKEEPWAKLAQQSYKGAMELNKRIDELFDLTRNEIGVLQLNCKWANPIEMVRQLVDMVGMQCQSSGHVLYLDMPESLPQIYCDPQRLKQVLGNLIENACNHTAPGTSITLRMRLENDGVLFKVEDSGQGIAEEKLKDIFTSYSKVERRDENYGGLGLGLSICKTFVALHGGEIQVKSKENEGSCFWFAIPINGHSVIKQPEQI
jgi:PAS domain S-box-containing protein